MSNLNVQKEETERVSPFIIIIFSPVAWAEGVSLAALNHPHSPRSSFSLVTFSLIHSRSQSLARPRANRPDKTHARSEIEFWGLSHTRTLVNVTHLTLALTPTLTLIFLCACLSPSRHFSFSLLPLKRELSHVSELFGSFLFSAFSLCICVCFCLSHSRSLSLVRDVRLS